LSGKYCFSEGQEIFFMLLGFWDYLIITLTGSTSSWSYWPALLPSAWQCQGQRSVSKFTLSLVMLRD